MKFAAILALGFLTSVGLFAQTTVHLEGRVTKANGHSAPEAQVAVTDTTSKATFVTSANRKGKYSMDFVAEKNHTYTVSAKQGSLASVPRPFDPRHVPDELNFSVGPRNTSSVNQPATYNFSKNILQSGTPIKLVLQENLSSADATQGQQVAFKVVDDVIVNGYLLISHGGLAKGTITEAQAKRRMGRAGKLNVNIDYALMTDGEHAMLSAVKDAKGDGRGAAVTVGVTATAIVFFPAAPLFLLMHGKDIKIPEGTEITAFTNGDIRFDPEKFAKVEAAK